MKREENESYEDYVERRKQDNIKTQRRLKGIKVWPGDWGTYNSSIDGAVESRLKSMMDKLKNEKDGKI
jgi:hypothetical protein|tara:strand:+ start:578 stop:781 length:204 start_codon:yes stop_codon:yes gene_type:complete